MEGFSGEERRLHACSHEEDITLLKERQINVDKKLDQMGSDVHTILRLLQGDSERPGLLTKTELVKESLKRAWWFLGVGTTALVVALISHLFGGN